MSSQKSPFFMRMASPDDAQACHDIDVEAWGEDSAASVDMLRSRIDTYPCGNFVAIDRATGEIVGSVWTVATDEKPFSTWMAASGSGTYSGICNRDGDLLIGINVSVRPPYLGRGIGEMLVARAGETAWSLGKRKAVLGARMPEYHAWQDVLSAEDYIRVLRDISGRAYFRNPSSGTLHEGPMVDDLRQVAAGARIDPRTWPLYSADPGELRVLDAELAFFLDIHILGQRCRLYQLLPGYFPDPHSCDNGVLIGWENEEHPAWAPLNP